jgi:hypothetical protein
MLSLAVAKPHRTPLLSSLTNIVKLALLKTSSGGVIVAQSHSPDAKKTET